MSFTFSKKSSLSVLIKILVSVGFVWWLVYKVHWMEVWLQIRTVNVWWLALYAVVLVASIGISARKWQIIVRFKGFECGWWESYRVYLTGMFINNFLPSVIGGDTYRALWLIRQDKRYREAVSTLIFDRFTGLWAVMVLATIFALWNWRIMVAHPLWWMFIAGIVLLLLLDIALPFLRRTELFQKGIRYLPGRFQRMIEELSLYTRVDVLRPVLLWGFLFNIIGVAVVNYILFIAFGNPPSFSQFAAIIFLVSIVSSIPVSIGNIGIKEWAYYTFFGFVGGNPETAITVALVSRFVQMFVSFFALPTYIRAVRQLSFPSPNDLEVKDNSREKEATS